MSSSPDPSASGLIGPDSPAAGDHAAHGPLAFGRAGRAQSYPVLPEYRGAAEVWLDPDQPQVPVTAVDSAAVVLIRDSPRGIETYLTVHERRSPFGPVAFPGDRVLPVDDDALPWSGPTGKQWGRLWQEEVGTARRCVVAAARELFVSTGILLAGPDTSSTMMAVSGSHDWSPSRRAVADGDISLPELLRERRLVLQTELLRPLARWVTPEFLHRRADVRFFLAIQPEGQEPSPLRPGQHPGGWASPREVLQGLDSQELAQILSAPELAGRSPQGILTPAASSVLRELAAADSAIAAAARRPWVQPRMPQLRTRADGTPEIVVDPRPPGSRQR